MKLFGFGTDQTFYQLLDRQAEIALQAAQAFHALTSDYGRVKDYLHRMDQLEHSGDEVAHQLALLVDRSFVTPLDKEDIHAISNTLDDVTDAIENVINLMVMYRLPDVRPDIEIMASLLVRTMEATQEIVSQLRHITGLDAIQPLVIRINQLENQGDDTYKEAIEEIFHAPDRDPFTFYAWKEVYDGIEDAIDKCEYVANSIQGMVVKYA